MLGAAATDDGKDIWAFLHYPGHGDRAKRCPIPDLVSYLLERRAHTFLLSRLWSVVTDRRAALDLCFGLEFALMRDHRQRRIPDSSDLDHVPVQARPKARCPFPLRGTWARFLVRGLVSLGSTTPGL